MKKYLKCIVMMLTAITIVSCQHIAEIDQTTPPVTSTNELKLETDIMVDGVELATRASSEAGYTTGDGSYHKGDQYTVAAFANEGYELVRFYEKSGTVPDNGESSYTQTAIKNMTYRAEFRKVEKYTITVTATSGGTATGGGKYKGGTNCTVNATPQSGYGFLGWWANGRKISSKQNYTFNVSADLELEAKFSPAKTFYFEAMDNKGTVSHASVTYAAGQTPITVTAIPAKGCTFDYWEYGDRNDYFSGFSSIVINDDFIADPYNYDKATYYAFFSGSVILTQNVITHKFGGMAIPTKSYYIEITSQYALESDISVVVRSYGEYVITVTDPDGSQRDEYGDFEARDESFTLKTGESKWLIKCTPIQIDSSARNLSTVHWAVNLTEFEDDSYSYKLPQRFGQVSL